MTMEDINKIDADTIDTVTPERVGYVRSGLTQSYPEDSTLSIVFANQAAQFPDATAVIFEEYKLKYRELDSASNFVATKISEKLGSKRKPDVIIALCLERTDIMVITLLATLKAGVAYVAIDPKYPSGRIQFILEDTEALVLITDTVTDPLVSQFMDPERILKLSRDELPQVDDTQVMSTPPVSIGTKDYHLSHILYTSGTTGKPKGVQVTREALITDCLDYRVRYGIRPGSNEVILYFLNYVFNAATVPFLTALSNGFPLLIVRPTMLFETEKFYDYLHGHGVTHIDATPSLVARLDLSRLPTLKRIAIGGELLTPEAFRHFKTTAPEVEVFNIFGNSEGTLCVAYDKVERESDTRIFRTVTVNKRSYLLLNSGDEIGELAISGRGLARGYLKNEKLTRERFIPNPFQTAEDKMAGNHATLLKTGDLFRLLPSGDIESVGRSDHQIKIRGYRVELGEIEEVIRSYQDVSQSVVVPKNLELSEQVTLIAYFVNNEKIGQEEAVLKHIQTMLPDYMIPARIIQLDEMPLTINGKIDRNALPPPPPLIMSTTTIDDMDSSAGISTESNDPILKSIITMWRDILNLDSTEEYSLDADFFESGGNSLLAMRLVERVNVDLGISINAAHVFQFSTISEFFENLPISN